MAGRNGHNLVEGALKMASAPGRSHPARLKALLRHFVQVLGQSSATLFLPDRSEPVLTQRLNSAHPSDAFAVCTVPIGAGCAGRCARDLTPVTLTASELHPDEPIRAEETSFTSFPVLNAKELVAVLSFASRDPAASAALKREVRELLPVLGLMLAQLQAQMQLSRERRNLTLLNELSQLFHVPQAPAQLLPRLIRLCNGSELSHCVVVRLTEGGGGSPRLFKGVKSHMRVAVPALLMMEERLTSAAQALGQEQELGLDSGEHALCLPISFDHRSFGTVTFFGTAEMGEPRQKELARSVVRLLSRALAEAISTERISSFFTEKDKKLKELSLLYRMSNTMLSTIKLNKLIHLTLTALTSGPIPFFDRAMLFLTNERSGVLVGMLGVTTKTAPLLSASDKDDLLTSRWDISDEQMSAQRESEFSTLVRGSRVELNGSLNVASRAVLEKRLIFVPDPESEPLDALHSDDSPFAVAPLIAHGQAVGAVIVDNAISKAQMTQEDLRFLQLFTNQAGMAIENSILYNQVEDANRQLFEAQEHLLQKERLAAIGEAATGIAHELKGPLVSIGGFAGRLTKKLVRDTPEHQHAELIVREVLRLESVLSEILLFAKKATICYTSCDIVEVVKESLAVVRPSLEERQIRINAQFPETKFALLGDGQQLMQVFINLFLNAVDAMPTGGRLGIELSGADLDGAPAVAVRITDTGGGIPLEALKNIFTPFYTTKESGTGLGLPIANRIVTNHGGKILLSNHAGEGAEFKVVLPLTG